MLKRKIFIHINTTNPSLLENSKERKIANENGWEIAYDTMEITFYDNASSFLSWKTKL